jgi:FSR family fosmidomycin resistance protein-like MFS transporter
MFHVSKPQQTISFTRRRQWCQLLALTFTHAVADTYVGIVAPVLAPLRDHYSVSIALLIFVASLLGFSSNVFQLPIGHLRATWSSPILICCGVLLAGTSVFITALPAGPLCVVWMSLIALAAGLGVATVHPEGLRAVHGLDKIPSSLSTAVFMVAGFLGFAGGALISSTLTENYGLGSLVWLYCAAPIAATPLLLSGIRLPIETDIQKEKSALEQRENVPHIPFLPLFAIAATLATCSQIQATLLPTYLHEEVGYSLSFSGFSFTLFGIGGMVGAITWGALAPRLGHLRVLLFTTLAGAPLTLLYLLLAPHSKKAAALLAFTAFIVYTGFPLCITLARYADSSLRFGQRMGIISGGTWGSAAVVLWILGPISEHTGMGSLLHLIWIGYLAAAAFTVWLIRRQSRNKAPISARSNV